MTLAELSGSVPSVEYKLFISHAWEYKGDYEGVVRLLNTDLTFWWRNLSVEESNPLPGLFHLPKSNRSLVRQLDGLISKADCLLVIDAMYVSHRPWIQSEIEAAQDFGKPIVAIAPQGQERFPRALEYSAHERVGWNSASIIGAIRRLATPSSLQSVRYRSGLATPVAPLVAPSPGNLGPVAPSEWTPSGLLGASDRGAWHNRPVSLAELAGDPPTDLDFSNTELLGLAPEKNSR
jgi:hypothetical protein